MEYLDYGGYMQGRDATEEHGSHKQACDQHDVGDNTAGQDAPARSGVGQQAQRQINVWAWWFGHTRVQR
jgi:hypothetical protein